MTVLLTRPKPDSQRIARELEKVGIGSIIWPLTEIVQVEKPITISDGTDALVFTSSHGVRAFAHGNERRDLKVFCVGQRTAALAQAAGFKDVQSAGGGFDALVALLRDAAPASVFYPRARDISNDLEAVLRPNRIRCDSQIVYSAQPTTGPAREVDVALTAGNVDVITIWSRRNAELLSESFSRRSDWRTNRITLLAISQNAAAGLGNAGFRRIIVASRPNATQMIAEIRGAVR